MSELQGSLTTIIREAEDARRLRDMNAAMGKMGLRAQSSTIPTKNGNPEEDKAGGQKPGKEPCKTKKFKAPVIEKMIPLHERTVGIQRPPPPPPKRKVIFHFIRHAQVSLLCHF
jgi:hypothetical protein